MPTDEFWRKFKLEFQPEFFSSLDEIYEYISEVWQQNSVDNFHFEMMKKLENLANFPRMNARFRATNFRFFLVWDYLVFYKIDDENSRAIVYKTYHSARNLNEILEDLE